MDSRITATAYKASGGDPVKLKELLYGAGLVKPAMAAEAAALDSAKKRGDIAHTAAQTGEIGAGHIAGAFAALAQAGGSDAGVSAARDILAATVGPEMATAALAPLLKMPPELRLAYAVQQAGAHKTGQEAIKLFFPAAHMQDFGGTVAPVSTSTIPGGPAPGTVIPGAKPIVKTQTPDSVASTASAAASRAQAERHFQAGQDAPQYMETDAGIIALPKKPAAGPIVGRTVAGPGGEVLGKPLKPLPPSVNEAIIGNAQSLYTLDKALKLLEGKDVDSAKGDKEATGWKGYIPQWALNRIDEKGVDTRAEISDIGSLKIHDRSGAAVTVSESPRLMPFIPLATDPRDVAEKKVKRLMDEARRMQQGLTETYSKEQGYKPNPILEKAAKPVPKVDKTVPEPARSTAAPGIKFLGFES